MRAKLKKGVEMVRTSAAMGALSSLAFSALSLCLFLFPLFHGALAHILSTIFVHDER